MPEENSIDVANIQQQVELSDGSLTVCYQTVSDDGDAERRIKLIAKTQDTVITVRLSEANAQEWSDAIAAVLAAE